MNKIFFFCLLFVFDLEGRFIRKIGKIGQGSGEYLEIRDFTMDTVNCILFLCDAGNRVHKFKFDGTYINTITIQSPDSHSLYIHYYNERLYANYIERDRVQQELLLLEIDPSDGKVLSRLLPKEYNKGWNELVSIENSHFFISRANNPPRISLMFADYIFSIEEEITPYIELKSKNMVTDKNIENLPNGQSLFESLMQLFQGSSKIWDVHSFAENDDFIIFRHQTGFFQYNSVVFNKKTKAVRLANYLANDLLFMHDRDGFWGDFKFSDNKGAYGVLPAVSLGKFQEYIKSYNVQPSLDKLNQLKKLNEEPNPVIFYYEFK